MTVAVVGGGPAGLMAAEVLSQRGLSVDVYDAMPSVGRKFLLAGKGGLNLTHSEPLDAFLSRYGERRSVLEPWIRRFGPAEIREWARGLGAETFVGSSGRVFPTDFKAAPLLRSWLSRLRRAGVRFHVRHRWIGFSPEGLSFENGLVVRPRATVLALGGASWPKLGSDGAWASLLPSTPLKPANCGFEAAWSAVFRTRYEGHPVKSVVARFEGVSRQGEFVVTAEGVEGSLIYSFAAALREAIERDGYADLELDLAPDRGDRPRGKRSLSEHLRRVLGITGVKAGLVHELKGEPKRLQLRLLRTRPLAEAISTAGGVPFEALDEGLMLKSRPGVFCAGEMLDWEAPTGGYLLTACLATGRHAGESVAAYL